MHKAGKEKLIASDGFCYTCGNKGFTDKVCPDCGKEPRKLSIVSGESPQFLGKITRFGVPAVYQGNAWNAERLKNSFPEKKENPTFQRFVERLDKINNLFVKGLLTEYSALIIAPAGYSKMTFAYSCMQRALDAGFSVAPFLDTVELKRFLTLSGENPNYKLFNKMSYEEYILSDVCFVTVTKLPAREWAFNAIQELLDRRSRKGLSTFVISRYNLSEISRKDASNEFSAIERVFSDDYYKYPTIIRYLGK